MSSSGKLDTNCGIYDYKFAPNPQPPKSTSGTPSVPNPNCHGGNTDGKYLNCWHDVQEDKIDSCINAISCASGTVDNSMQNCTQVYKGSQTFPWSTYLVYMTVIGWIPGCDKYDKMNIGKPAGKDGPNYKTILKNNWSKCELADPYTCPSVFLRKKDEIGWDQES